MIVLYEHEGKRVEMLSHNLKAAVVEILIPHD
jgi:hypothetical protein